MSYFRVGGFFGQEEAEDGANVLQGPAANDIKIEGTATEETRVDPADGEAYTKAEFIEVSVTRMPWHSNDSNTIFFFIHAGEISDRHTVERSNGMLQRSLTNLQLTVLNPPRLGRKG